MSSKIFTERQQTFSAFFQCINNQFSVMKNQKR